MRVKLLQDQYYVSETDGNKFGKKDEIVNIDPLFYKLISAKCKPVKNDEQKQDEKSEEKPLDKMNKVELVEKAKTIGLELTQEEIEAMTKADIIKLIVDKQND